MQLPIKNMVCPRCIMAVEQILNRLDIPFQSVQMGFVELDKELSKQQTQEFEKELSAIGFEVLQDRKQRILEDIKLALQDLVNKENEQALKTSAFLAERLNLEYNYISSLFSELQGEPLEQYLIKLKVEKVKEYLQYDLALSEIADKLHYSSIAHLSSQFKKMTGLTPSGYKKQNRN